VATEDDTPTVEQRPAPAKKPPVIPSRDLSALAVALAFLAIGFGAILLVAQVAEVKDGAALAALLIVPALLYLVFSGRVTDLKGPGGLEVQLSQVANQAIPVGGADGGTSALSYDQVRAVERGRRESLIARVKDITPEEPVVLTLTLGSGDIDAGTAADYAKGLTQFPRFRFVAVLDSHGKLISYMEESAFRHVIESGLVDSKLLLGAIAEKNVGAVRAYPGMIVSSVSPGTRIADALREMERLRINALLVTQDGEIKGIVERDRLANTLLLSLVDRASA
jgi:CBS domain-containing protein